MDLQNEQPEENTNSEVPENSPIEGDASCESRPQWGGARVGAGRKALIGEDRTKYVGIRLTEREALKLKQLGGSRWIRKMLEKA